MQQNVVGAFGTATPLTEVGLAVQLPPEAARLNRKSPGCCAALQVNGITYGVAAPLHPEPEANTLRVPLHDAPATAPQVHAEQPRVSRKFA
jgi:hypothetical protein